MSKNMCSVRHRPMPSAPILMAFSASYGRVGVGADFEGADGVAPFHEGFEFGGLLGFFEGEFAEENTSPVPPSRVRNSPALTVFPPAVNSPVS